MYNYSYTTVYQAIILFFTPLGQETNHLAKPLNIIREKLE